MSGRNIFLVAVVILVVAAAVLAKWILHDGLSARATPSRLETFLARNSRFLSIPSGAREAANPVADSAQVQHDARLHFADHCAVCHGNDGSGDTMMGRGMYPKPPDLRAEHTQKLSDGELFWIIENGVRFTGMPAFAGGEHAKPEDSWKLVRFIRHLPQLTTEERMEMERYNPKGPDEREEEQQEEDFLKGGAPQPKSGMEHHHH